MSWSQSNDNVDRKIISGQKKINVVDIFLFLFFTLKSDSEFYRKSIPEFSNAFQTLKEKGKA